MFMLIGGRSWAYAFQQQAMWANTVTIGARLYVCLCYHAIVKGLQAEDTAVYMSVCQTVLNTCFCW